MANAGKLLDKITPLRGLIVGYPGSGKTGSLAALVNAGFKIRMIDFDGNYQPLLVYSDPKLLAKNVDIVSFEDKLRVPRGGDGPIQVSGIPTAFADSLKMMTHWKYTDDDGTEVDLGRNGDWGPDTILVIDSLTGMGRTAMNRALKMGNRKITNRRRQEWGVAAAEQESFIEMVTSAKNRHHTLVLSHLKMVGPKDIGDADEELTKALKERAASIVPTRLYPTALGWALPQHIHEHFPLMCECVQAPTKKTPNRRVINTYPRSELDLKAAAEIPQELPIDSGMLTIFKSLVDVEKCLASTMKGE